MNAVKTVAIFLIMVGIVLASLAALHYLVPQLHIYFPFSSTTTSNSNPTTNNRKNNTTSINFKTTKMVMIRFDDSSEDQLTIAYPVLKQCGFTAVFAEVVKTLNAGTGAGEEGTISQPQTGGQVTQLYLQGNQITDHSFTHAHLGSINESRLDI